MGLKIMRCCCGPGWYDWWPSHGLVEIEFDVLAGVVDRQGPAIGPVDWATRHKSVPQPAGKTTVGSPHAPPHDSLITRVADGVDALIAQSAGTPPATYTVRLNRALPTHDGGCWTVWGDDENANALIIHVAQSGAAGAPRVGNFAPASSNYLFGGASTGPDLVSRRTIRHLRLRYAAATLYIFNYNPTDNCCGPSVTVENFTFAQGESYSVPGASIPFRKGDWFMPSRDVAEHRLGDVTVDVFSVTPATGTYYGDDHLVQIFPSTIGSTQVAKIDRAGELSVDEVAFSRLERAAVLRSDFIPVTQLRRTSADQPIPPPPASFVSPVLLTETPYCAGNIGNEPAGMIRVYEDADYRNNPPSGPTVTNNGVYENLGSVPRQWVPKLGYTPSIVATSGFAIATDAEVEDLTIRPTTSSVSNDCGETLREAVAVYNNNVNLDAGLDNARLRGIGGGGAENRTYFADPVAVAYAQNDFPMAIGLAVTSIGYSFTREVAATSFRQGYTAPGFGAGLNAGFELVVGEADGMVVSGTTIASGQAASRGPAAVELFAFQSRKQSRWLAILSITESSEDGSGTVTSDPPEYLFRSTLGNKTLTLGDSGPLWDGESLGEIPTSLPTDGSPWDYGETTDSNLKVLGVLSVGLADADNPFCDWAMTVAVDENVASGSASPTTHTWLMRGLSRVGVHRTPQARILSCTDDWLYLISESGGGGQMVSCRTGRIQGTELAINGSLGATVIGIGEQ